MSNKKHRNKNKPVKPQLKILWSSNGIHSSSGYATQSGLILKKMKQDGYDVRMQAFFGLMGGKAEIDGIPVYPRLAAPWGEDGLVAHARNMNADVVFTFQDIWPMDPNFLRQVKYWVPYVPIDGDPLSPHIKARLNLAHEIVTYSKFGHDMLVKNGYASTYIPHSVDTSVLFPRDKEKSREMFRLPKEKFIFGMVAANKDNPSRKSFQEVIDAFTEVNKKRPDTALYFHTNLIDTQGGFPIMEYCAFKGLQGKVFTLDPYTMQFELDRQAIAHLYSSFDCLLNPSNSEGFGMAIIEAQACGVPVVVNNAHSMPELVGAGEICEVGYKRWVQMGSYACHPKVSSLIEKMESMYTRITGGEREKLSSKAVKFVKDNYDNDMVYDKYWRPYLLRLEHRLKQKS